jgi:hypothetical protein
MMPTDVRIVSAADDDSSGKDAGSTEAPVSNNNRSTVDDTTTHQNLNVTSAASSASSRENVEARLQDSLVAWGDLKRISREVGTFVISARLARKRMSMSPASAEEEDKHTKRQKMDTADTATASSAVRSLPSSTGLSQQQQARLKKLMDTFVIMQRAQEAFEEEIKATLEDWKADDDEDSDKNTKQAKK